MKKDRNRHINSNQSEFKKFFDEFYPFLVIFANKYLKDQSKAEDIVQDCFVYFYENEMSLDNEEKAKSYLYTIAKSKCLNILRYNSVRKEYSEKLIEETELFYCENLIEQETYSLLLNAVNKLPEQTGKVVCLMLRGYKNNEIAEALNISVNTVRSLKQAAIKKLRLTLEEYIFLFSILKNKSS